MEVTTSAIEAVKALPEPVARRGITEAQWRTLMTSLYPGAKAESVLMVIDYCAARKLDPLKRPCHIVPMEVKDAKTGVYAWRDVVLPGIYELRTTAHRTGLYLGHTVPKYGPEIPVAGITAPEWCEYTIYRWNPDAGQRAEYPVRLVFRECVALGKDKKTANMRWAKAPTQMLSKCTEAAGLREAFPDEIGGQHTAEEMDGQRAIDVQTIDAVPPPVPPDGFDDWYTDLCAAADEGIEKLDEALEAAPADFRAYMVKHLQQPWDALKARALEKGGNR